MGVVKIYVLGVYNNYNIISFVEILHKHNTLMSMLFVQNSYRNYQVSMWCSGIICHPMPVAPEPQKEPRTHLL